MDTSITFARRLTELVSEKKDDEKITQNKIAKDLGVSVGALSNYLSGAAEAKIGFCVTASTYFGVSADWLLGLSDVRSTNSELRAACEYTGLSEKSIGFIADTNNAPINEDGDFASYLSRIFEQTAFQLLLLNLYSYLSANTAEILYDKLWDKYYPKDEDEMFESAFKVSQQKLDAAVTDFISSSDCPERVRYFLQTHDLIWSTGKSDERLTEALTEAEDFKMSYVYEHHANRYLLRTLEELAGDAEENANVLATKRAEK